MAKLTSDSSKTTCTLPPGKYYIGDPCYVFNQDEWSELLEKTDFFREEGEAEWKGRKMAVFSTKYGDGLYSDGGGSRFPVDAGILGAVPIDLLTEPLAPEMTVHDTQGEPLECSSCDGVVVLGPFSINTGEDPEECEDDEDYHVLRP